MLENGVDFDFESKREIIRVVHVEIGSVPSRRRMAAGAIGRSMSLAMREMYRLGLPRGGAPINDPMAPNVLYDSRWVSHIAIFLSDPGCSNKDCGKYRKWEWNA